MLEMLRATLCAWMRVPSAIFHQAVNGICLISPSFLGIFVKFIFLNNSKKTFLGESRSRNRIDGREALSY